MEYTTAEGRASATHGDGAPLRRGTIRAGLPRIVARTRRSDRGVDFEEWRPRVERATPPPPEERRGVGSTRAARVGSAAGRLHAVVLGIDVQQGTFRIQLHGDRTDGRDDLHDLPTVA